MIYCKFTKFDVFFVSIAKLRFEVASCCFWCGGRSPKAPYGQNAQSARRDSKTSASSNGLLKMARQRLPMQDLHEPPDRGL